MQFSEIKAKVIAEYDKRNLASNVRYNALSHFEQFLKENHPTMWMDVNTFPKDKEKMKEGYRKFNGATLSGAKSSVVNEIYNQLVVLGIL